MDYPDELILPLNVYLSPSWRKMFKDQEGVTKAKEVLSYVKEFFIDDSLSVKMLIVYEDMDIVPHDEELSIYDLEKMKNFISEPRQGRAAIVYLTTPQPGVLGYGYMNAICGKKKKKSRSIVQWSTSSELTAKTVAHEIGHNIGMSHDFAPTVEDGRDYSCGPEYKGGPGNQLMNYGEPMENSWSDCSNVDFKQYYTRVEKHQAFCLKEFHGRPTSYMKKININLTGKVLHKFSLSSGISCWHRCRDIINCDASHYQDKECSLYSKHDSHSGAGVAYFRAEAPNGYTVRLGDCPGNDLWYLYGNLVSLRECAKLCDDDKRCRGFMWYDRHECYPKSESCQSTSLDNTRNVFYSKLTSDSCPPGSFKKSLAQNSGCELCPIGEYQDQQGLTGDIYKCKPCTSKSGGDFLGSTSCLLL